METILTAFIVLALILFAVLTTFHGYLQAQDTLRVGWQEVQTRLSDQTHTDLTPLTAITKSSGAVVELTLRNDGDTRLMDFPTWDVIVQYYTAPGHYQIDWLTPINGEPGNGEWSVIGLYSNAAAATPEFYQPGIFNPGEEMLIRLRLLPPVGPSSINLVNITTRNGVGTAMQFIR